MSATAFRYVPGHATAVASGSVGLLVGIHPDDALVDLLLDALATPDPLDAVLATLFRGGLGALPPFGLVAHTDAGVRVILRGPFHAVAEGGETLRPVGGPWTDVTVPARHVALRLDGDAPGESVRFRGGSVQAGELEFSVAEPSGVVGPGAGGVDAAGLVPDAVGPGVVAGVAAGLGASSVASAWVPVSAVRAATEGIPLESAPGGLEGQDAHIAPDAEPVQALDVATPDALASAGAEEEGLSESERVEEDVVDDGPGGSDAATGEGEVLPASESEAAGAGEGGVLPESVAGADQDQVLLKDERLEPPAVDDGPGGSDAATGESVVGSGTSPASPGGPEDLAPTPPWFAASPSPSSSEQEFMSLEPFAPEWLTAPAASMDQAGEHDAGPAEQSLPADEQGAEAAASGPIHEADDLIAPWGALPGQAASEYVASASAAAERTKAEPAASDAADVPPDGAGGAPLVLAVRCPGGHLSPASATVCRVCHEAIPAQQRFETPRPLLGVLRLSSGETVTLERNLVLGRKPRVPDGHVGPEPELVVVPDPLRDISGQHLGVTLDYWNVLATDLGSTNGTQLLRPGREPYALVAGEPQLIEPGDTLLLADSISITYEVRP